MVSLIKISLIITSIHVCMGDGMILQEVRIRIQNVLDKYCTPNLSKNIQKPLFSCLICMSSFWGFIGCVYFKIPMNHCVESILIVCGVNTIISVFVKG